MSTTKDHLAQSLNDDSEDDELLLLMKRARVKGIAIKTDLPVGDDAPKIYEKAYDGEKKMKLDFPLHQYSFAAPPPFMRKDKKTTIRNKS